MRHLILTLGLVLVPCCQSMDYGSSGVWDSPMATDYWVKRFGFMWGGGSSGLNAIQAFKSASYPQAKVGLSANLYNPSGMYGLKAMDSEAPEYEYPGKPRADSASLPKPSGVYQTEKPMRELTPLMVKMPGDKKDVMFNRFMAVP